MKTPRTSMRWGFSVTTQTLLLLNIPLIPLSELPGVLWVGYEEETLNRLKKLPTPRPQGTNSNQAAALSGAQDWLTGRWPILPRFGHYETA